MGKKRSGSNMFFQNMLILGYIGLVTFYLFNDFLMFEERKNQNGTNIQSGDRSNRSEPQSMFVESLQYQQNRDSKSMFNFKIYLFLHNIILVIVFRLSISRQRQAWRNIQNLLTIILLFSSFYGVIVYILPIYNSDFSNQSGLKIKENSQMGVTLQDLKNEQKNDQFPWLEIILIGSITVPLIIVSIFLLTIIIILCIYLKENFRGIGKLFGRGDDSGVNRPDKEYENEMLKRQFSKEPQGHVELQEEFDPDEEDLRDQQTFQSKRQVMQFYIDMMPRSEYALKGSITDQSNQESIHQIDSNRAATQPKEKKKNDGESCTPLCEKRFKEKDILRTILPCRHVFHERCIKIWLFRGENQFCPYCRGNIMKKQLDSRNNSARFPAQHNLLQ